DAVCWNKACADRGWHTLSQQQTKCPTCIQVANFNNLTAGEKISISGITQTCETTTTSPGTPVVSGTGTIGTAGIGTAGTAGPSGTPVVSGTGTSGTAGIGTAGTAGPSGTPVVSGTGTAGIGTGTVGPSGSWMPLGNIVGEF